MMAEANNRTVHNGALPRPPSAHQEFRRFPANPGDEPAQPRMLLQFLDRVVLAFEFLPRVPHGSRHGRSGVARWSYDRCSWMA